MNGSLRRTRSGGTGPPPIPPVEARLGKLLQLPKRRPKPVSPVEAEPKGEVVLFTGVRYERGDPPANGPTVGAKRSRG